MTGAGSDDSSGVDVDAYVALLRREQQLDAIQRTLGWRLLSYYGPYKRRVVLPAWRWLRRLVVRRSPGGLAPSPSPLAAWAELSARVHSAMPPAATADLAREAAPSPAVSLIVTCDASSRALLDGTVAALLAQRYEGWEAVLGCVATTDETARAFWPMAAQEPRVHVDPALQPDHAAAVTAAFARARGTIVGIVPAGTALVPDALEVVVRAFETSACDVLYADEIVKDGAEVGGTSFNPGWSPDLLLSRMYWSRAVFHRRLRLAALMPLAPNGADALAYDLALRASERRATVVHVPRVLAGVDAASRARSPDAEAATARVLAAALARRGIAGTVETIGEGRHRVRRAIANVGRVSIVIPTRDGLAMLRRCLASIERVDHPDVEVLVVDNGSRTEAMRAYLATTRHRVVRAPGPFNFARLNNMAVAHTTGRYVLFLNDDTEPIGTDWLRALEEHAQRPEVGAVGAKLLYSDGRIQHAGIAVGIGGVAGHPHRFARTLADEIRDVSAVTAACLMMRRAVFDAVGGFDERLPINSNDVDLCLRVRARGYLVVYTSHAVLRHHESQTRGARARPDDAWLMTRRWRDVLRADPYYSPNLDRTEETGEPDLSKPDGLVCLYDGASSGDGVIELAAGDSVGQRVLATGPALTAVVLRATVVGPDPEHAVRLVIRGADEGTADVRMVGRSVAGRSHDERWFCFEPIADSSDRFWYLRLEVVGSHTVTLRRRTVASDVMGPCCENDAPAHGTLAVGLYGRAAHRSAVTA